MNFYLGSKLFCADPWLLDSTEPYPLSAVRWERQTVHYVNVRRSPLQHSVQKADKYPSAFDNLQSFMCRLHSLYYFTVCRGHPLILMKGTLQADWKTVWKILKLHMTISRNFPKCLQACVHAFVCVRKEVKLLIMSGLLYAFHQWDLPSRYFKNSPSLCSFSRPHCWPLTARTTLWMVLCRHSAALKAGCFSWFRQQQRWDLSTWFGFAMKGELEMAHPWCYRAVCSQLPCHTSCRHAPPPEHDGNVSLAFGLWVQGRLPFLAFCKYWRQNCAHASHCILTVQLGVRISHCSCGHWTGSHIFLRV